MFFFIFRSKMFNMKKLPALTAIIFFSIHSYSQLTQVIRGKILDKESRTPLIGANVIQLNSSPVNGTVSDIDGNFKLVVPVGRVSLKATYVGYEDATFSEILVMTGKEVYLNIELRESVSAMQEVVVKARKDKIQAINSMATISVRQLSTEDASRYASGFGDPSRMVSSFAGVGAVEGDGVNDIVIRGNSPRGMLWRLEGIEIPNPNHFTDGQGASGGAIGIITSSALANFDFYSGAFPAEYGNAFSGIMDLNLRKGNADKREYALQASVVGMEAAFEGPFKAGYGGSYLINYRYSTFALLSQAKIIDLGNNNLAPKFQDLNMIINLPTNKLGTFEFFAVGGMSTTGTVPIKSKIDWNDNQNRDSRYDELENHNMGVLGLKHVYNFSDKKTYTKIVLAGTRQYDAWDNGYLIDAFTRQYDYKDRYIYSALRGHFMINHKFNARHTIRAGVIVNSLYSEMFQKSYQWDLKKDSIRIDKNDQTSLIQAYAQWKFRLTDNFEFNSGLHFMYFALNGNKSVEPRFGMKWNFAERQSLSAGFGLHTRTEAIPAYFALVKMPNGLPGEGNKNVGFTKSLHSVVGYDIAFSENLRLKVEAYYQYLYDVPIVDTINSTMSALNFSFGVPSVPLKNKGTGYNRGIELTLEKFYSNNYYFLITGSLFDSKYKANNGKWYSTVFNNNLISNFLAGKDFKIRSNSFGASIKLLYRWGFRTTPLDTVMSKLMNDEVYQINKLYSQHLPDFFRIDLGLKYRFNRPGYSWVLSLDVQNAIDRKNVLGYEYNGLIRIPSEGMGLVPILNFRFEF
jgi:hypothetical protein